MVGLAAKSAPIYRPRQPRQSPLYRTIERYLPKFERIYDQRYAQQDGPWRSIIGDVVLGGRHTLVREAPWVPDVIVSVEGVIPTKDSSYGVGGALALVKSFDPAVLFANIGYRRTFARDFSDITLLQHEDTIAATVGYAFALNDTLTLSAAVSGVFDSRTSFDNAVLDQRERFSLRFGLTTLVSDDLYVEPLVSFGLNGDEANVTLGLSVPYTFTP